MAGGLPPVFVSGASLSVFGRRRDSLLEIIIEACSPLLKEGGGADAIVLEFLREVFRSARGPPGLMVEVALLAPVPTRVIA